MTLGCHVTRIVEEAVIVEFMMGGVAGTPHFSIDWIPLTQEADSRQEVGPLQRPTSSDVEPPPQGSTVSQNSATVRGPSVQIREASEDSLRSFYCPPSPPSANSCSHPDPKLYQPATAV